MFLNKRGIEQEGWTLVEIILAVVGGILVFLIIPIIIKSAVWGDKLCEWSVKVEDEAEKTIIFGSLLAGRIGDFCYTKTVEVKGSNEDVLKGIGDASARCAKFYHNLGDINLKEYCHPCFILNTGEINGLTKADLLNFLQGASEVPDKISKKKLNYWNFITRGGEDTIFFEVFADVDVSDGSNVIESDREYLVVFTSDDNNWWNLWSILNTDYAGNLQFRDVGVPRIALIDYDARILDQVCSLQDYVSRRA